MMEITEQNSELYVLKSQYGWGTGIPEWDGVCATRSRLSSHRLLSRPEDGVTHPRIKDSAPVVYMVQTEERASNLFCPLSDRVQSQFDAVSFTKQISDSVDAVSLPCVSFDHVHLWMMVSGCLFLQCSFRYVIDSNV